MSPLLTPCSGTRDERCSELVPVGTKRCAKHTRDENRRASKRKNAKPQRAFYESSRWRRETRPAVLDRDLHECQLCGATATHVDHQPPLTTLVDQGLDPTTLSTAGRSALAAQDGPTDTAAKNRPGSADASPGHRPELPPITASLATLGRQS